MDHIGYQVWDVVEEIIEEATKKQEEKQQRVQDQLATLQQLLEAASITKECRTEGGSSIILGKEAESVHKVLTQLAVGNRTLHIEMDTLEFPMSELKEQVNAC
jgi:hypothetical protein